MSRTRMRGCVSSRQRFQSNCLANADAALRGKRVAFSFARSLSLSLSSFSSLPFTLSRSFPVSCAWLTPRARPILGGHRAHAPVPTPSERLSLPLSLFPAPQLFSLSPFLSSSRAECIHIRAVHFSLYPVSFLGPPLACLRSLTNPPSRSGARPANRRVLFPPHRASRRARLST